MFQKWTSVPEMLQKLTKVPEMFQKLQKVPEMFQKLTKVPEMFHKLTTSSRNVPEDDKSSTKHQNFRNISESLHEF